MDPTQIKNEACILIHVGGNINVVFLFYLFFLSSYNHEEDMIRYCFAIASLASSLGSTLLGVSTPN